MINTLDLTHLRNHLPSSEAIMALLAFEQEGDLVRAAKVLQTSQPALSFHLKKLEASLDFPLFAFSGKKKVLTKMGKAYVRELQKMVKSYHHGSERILKEAQDIEHQLLRVAGRRELLIPFLPFPFPGKMEFIQTTSNEALESLKKHQVDLALSARLQESADLVAKLFFESGMKVIYPKEWKNFDLEHLRDRPVVVYGAHQAYLSDYLKARDIPASELQVNRVVEDWFSVVEWVRLGQGWALIPEEWKSHSTSVEEIHISEKVIEKQKVYLFFRKEDRKTLWVKHLENWLDSRDHKGGMRKLKSLIIGVGILFSLLKPAMSFAQAPAAAAGKEATGNSTFKYEATLSGGFLSFSSSSGQFNVAASFYYKPLKTDLLQLGGEYGLQKVSHRGITASNTALLAGVAVNIGNLSSAFYCALGLAIKGGSADNEDEAETDPNGLGYHFICGKRIPIGGNPSWVFKPNLGVIAGGTGGMVFRPLAISYLF